MDYRSLCRWAEGTLASVILWLHVVIFFCPDDLAGGGLAWLAAARDAQAVAGVSLIGAWAILGPGAGWIRTAVIPALIAVWSVRWQEGAGQPRELSAWFLPSLFCMTGLALLSMRLIGMRVAKPAAEAAPKPFQMSLLGLIVLITAIAGVLGLLQGVRHLLGDWDVEISDLGRPLRGGTQIQLALQARAIVIGSTAALSGIGGIWIVLRPGVIWPRLAAALVLISALCVYLTYFTGFRTALPAEAATLGVALFAIMAIGALTTIPLRLIGYRLQRRTVNSTVESVRHKLPWRDWPLEAIVFVNVAAAAWFLAPALQWGLEWGRNRMREPLTLMSEGIDSLVVSQRSISIITGAGQFVWPQADVPILQPGEDPFAMPANIAGEERSEEVNPK